MGAACWSAGCKPTAFEKDRLVVTGAQQERHLVFPFEKAAYQEVDPTQTPKAIDLTPLDARLPVGERQTFGAIYLLDGNELWIADFSVMVGFDPAGRLERPESFDMLVGITLPLRVLVFRRTEEQGGKRDSQ